MKNLQFTVVGEPIYLVEKEKKNGENNLRPAGEVVHTMRDIRTAYLKQ
jgi:hypothetical protein